MIYIDDLTVSWYHLWVSLFITVPAVHYPFIIICVDVIHGTNCVYSNDSLYLVNCSKNFVVFIYRYFWVLPKSCKKYIIPKAMDAMLNHQRKPN